MQTRWKEAWQAFLFSSGFSTPQMPCTGLLQPGHSLRLATGRSGSLHFWPDAQFPTAALVGPTVPPPVDVDISAAPNKKEGS